MATTQPMVPKFEPMTLSQFFNKIKGDFSSLPPIGGGSVPTRTQNLPNGGGSYQTPSGQAPNMSMAPVNQSKVPLKSVYNGTGAPAPQSKPSSTAGAPTSKPASTTGGPQSVIPPQWVNPATGGLYTPEEIANNIALSAPGAKKGDIPKFAGDQFTEGPQTSEQLQATAAGLNNARNDIAVGEKDPYKVGAESGIQYTPQELAAIEKAYAGVYDPAINTALAKLDRKQKEDEDERQFQQDLKKMEVQYQYDKKLKSIGTGGGSGSSNQMIDNERAAQTLFQNNPIVKDYNTVISQKNSLDRVIANGVGGPADVNAIFNFMKALDPNSVVRESEYDKAAASGNIFQGAFAKFNGYFKDKGGFLPDNVRDEFQNLINQRLAAQKVAYDNVANQTREIVKRQGMNPNNVVIDFSGGIENLGQQPAVDPVWLNTPDYENDLAKAKAAIAQGASPSAVRARLLTKYKDVPQL